MDAETNKKRELHCDMRAVMKFYCLRENTPTKTFEKIKFVYGDNFLSQTQMFALHNKFSDREKQLSCAIANIVDNHQCFLPKLMLNIVRTLI